ncbi:MAG TPA: RHS repeat-associated core domain-containing protein [Phycisphaerae bacterium]|nr:RHS repeat-associated core domain-containing protein [Phycisphaerae bacterium]
MLNPTLGRFVQSDPVGFVDGLNLYNAVRNDPVRFRDPDGRQSTQPATTQCNCHCKNHPEDCFLVYSKNPGVVFQMGEQNKTGKYQQISYAYKVELKSKTNHDLGGCNLHQSVTTTEVYLNKADAKAKVPDDFDPPVDKDGFESTVKGDTVTTKTPNDYRNAGLVIEDNPGIFVSDSEGSEKIRTSYRFTANNYVEEAPGVKGSIEIGADFDWIKFEAKFFAHSSDGNIKYDDAR